MTACFCLLSPPMWWKGVGGTTLTQQWVVARLEVGTFRFNKLVWIFKYCYEGCLLTIRFQGEQFCHWKAPEDPPHLRNQHWMTPRRCPPDNMCVALPCGIHKKTQFELGWRNRRNLHGYTNQLQSLGHYVEYQTLFWGILQIPKHFFFSVRNTMMTCGCFKHLLFTKRHRTVTNFDQCSHVWDWTMQRSELTNSNKLS